MAKKIKEVFYVSGRYGLDIFFTIAFRTLEEAKRYRAFNRNCHIKIYKTDLFKAAEEAPTPQSFAALLANMTVKKTNA